MKLELHSTYQIVEIDLGGGRYSVPARVWEGVTGAGVPVQVLIARIAVHRDHDTAEFDRELVECPPKSPTFRAFDARFFLD